MIWDAEVMAVLTSVKSTLELRGSVSVYMVAHCFLLQFFSSRTHSGTLQGVHLQQPFRKDCILKTKCKTSVGKLIPILYPVGEQSCGVLQKCHAYVTKEDCSLGTVHLKLRL